MSHNFVNLNRLNNIDRTDIASDRIDNITDRRTRNPLSILKTAEYFQHQPFLDKCNRTKRSPESKH